MEKRIKVKLKHANPLFRQWLQEWIDEAEKKKKKISKTYQRGKKMQRNTTLINLNNFQR